LVAANNPPSFIISLSLSPPSCPLPHTFLPPIIYSDCYFTSIFKIIAQRYNFEARIKLSKKKMTDKKVKSINVLRPTRTRGKGGAFYMKYSHDTNYTWIVCL
jgi:hypothetical protein